MLDVKDSDPTLRRFGKYLNLETAAVYNKNERKKLSVDLDEYVLGEYVNEVEYDNQGKVIKKKMKSSKKDIAKLLEGTSFDGVERTAFANYDDIIKRAFGISKGGEVSEETLKQYMDRKQEIDKAIGPAFISSSLKYLSGSEQLVSAVDFIMGYKEDRDENGDKVMKSKWDDYDERTAAELRRLYMRSAFDYLNGQTSTQILGLRTDYRDPMKRHLVDMYLVEDDEMSLFRNFEEKREDKDFSFRAGWDDDMKKEREELKNKYYAATDEKTRKEIREDMAAAQLRNMLDARGGKLLQIYESKRSGAANNAKDWLRKMIGLDNPEMIKNRIKRENNKAKQEKTNDKITQPYIDAVSGGDTPSVELYTGMLDNFLSTKGINIASSSREEFVSGIKQFAADTLKSTEFDKKFDDFCNDVPNATNNTVFDGFLKLLEEHLSNK